MGIILAKVEMFRRSGANQNVHVMKGTSCVGQYLIPKKANSKNRKD